MRALGYDAHVETDFSDGTDSVADCVRAAEAISLKCVAITDHYHFREAELPRNLAAIRSAGNGADVRVLAGVGLDIVGIDGGVSLSADAARPFDFVVASLGGYCKGVDIEAPARTSIFLDNLFACYAATVKNPVVDVLGRPFDLGRFPASVGPGELPRGPLRQLADLMYEREVAFELYAPVHFSYDLMPPGQFTREYASLLTIFRNAGVKFIAASGARSSQGVGNTRYCQVLMAAAGIELSQLVDLVRI